MAAMIFAGFILCLAMLLTMARLDLLKFLGYAAIVDVLFTIVMFEMFAGTFMGIVAGAVSGLCMTSMLYILKGALGYKRFSIKRMQWVQYGPTYAPLFTGNMNKFKRFMSEKVVG